MPRHICFDIETNYFRSPTSGFINTPDQARSEIESWSNELRFDAAVVFDDEFGQFADFGSPTELIEFLKGADELVSFNGRTWDLPLLERFVGKANCKSLWDKPHHDLRGWLDCDLLISAKRSCPDLFGRSDELSREYLDEYLKKGKGDFVAFKFAKARIDVRLTYALFEGYFRGGETTFTFSGDA
jgi:hypothetical protein